MTIKVYRIAVPVEGEEIYDVAAYSKEDAIAHVYDGTLTPFTEVNWAEDPSVSHIVDEWDEED